VSFHSFIVSASLYKPTGASFHNMKKELYHIIHKIIPDLGKAYGLGNLECVFSKNKFQITNPECSQNAKKPVQ